ncbi:MAG TPA: AAA family ATPase [Acidisoma sp.]|uniref:AAA family ATPase n=1 Tax=Acidisoma sp. TaxID=1872115 RepID=UPI002CBC0C30|nr:AAA family ATPase [Acidisoma sp.]HTH99552.1 AAA family ATPase [Acidisoma sp.]
MSAGVTNVFSIRGFRMDDVPPPDTIPLAQAAAGIPLFPAQTDIDPHPKAPMPAVRWRQEATTDPTTTRQWLRRWPNAAIGWPIPQGIVVFDIDGEEGLKQWAALWAPHGGVPDLPHVVTPSGGRHYYFALPPDVTHGNTLGALLPKVEDGAIDVRGYGGYVIAPGSWMPSAGVAYEAAGSVYPILNPPEIPSWLLKILQGSRCKDQPKREAAPAREVNHGTPSGGSRDQNAHPRVQAWAEKGIGDEIDRLAACGAGGRNDQLNKSAMALGQFVAAGFLDRREAEALLEQACATNGLTADDGVKSVRATIWSGMTKGLTEPRAIPDSIRAVIENDWSAAEFGRRAVAPALARMADRTTFGRETSEVIEAPGQSEDDLLPVLPASALAGQPVPEQEWLIKDVIVANNVAIVGGDGGTGKSLLALQLAHSVASGAPWLGFDVQRGKAMYLSAEDELGELHRRLHAMGADFANLPGLFIAPLAGLDALLAAPNAGRDAPLAPTKLFHLLRKRVAEYRPSLLVLDTLADLFGGNEIIRSQVRQFIGMLRGLALEYRVTVVLLAHPSQAGKNSGDGSSGSTAWNNSVRSRLYLFRPQDGDPDVRVLELKKSNRSSIGTQITLRYLDGQFVREDAGAVAAVDKRRLAERVFLDLLRNLPSKKYVSHNPGSNYAPAYFVSLNGAQGISVNLFKAAMNRLLDSREIEISEYGPPSRRRSYLALAGTVDTPSRDGETSDEQVE